MKPVYSALGLLLFLAASLTSCAGLPEPTYEPEFKDSLVRVIDWRNAGKEELATGVVVGDGSQVLTVLDYEDYTASGSFDRGLVYDLRVSSDKYGMFSAAVAAIDPRTGATLLWLKDDRPGKYVDLPVADTGNASPIKEGQDVFIYGWAGAENTLTFREARAYSRDDASLMFRVTEDIIGKGETGYFVSGLGSVITTKDNAVLGLLGTWGTDKLLIRSFGPGMLPPAVSINEALELQKAAISKWTQGPAVVVIGTPQSAGDYLPGGTLKLAAREDLSLAIRQIINQAGAPMTQESVGLDRVMIVFNSSEAGGGTIVVAAFPQLTNIRDMPGWAGNTLATAKWVGVQFNRPAGLPNRLLWGTETYVVEGAFELGEVSELERAIPASFYERS